MQSVDTIVVGAGIAGLVAARELTAAGQSVCVLEARDRVGGRTTGHRLSNGFTIELGGQWVGPKQGEILKLIDELGLETSPTYDTGQGVIVRDGVVFRIPQGDQSFGHDEADIPEIISLGEQLEAMAEGVSLQSPWLTGDATSLDRQTLASWLDASTNNPRVKLFYEGLAAALFSCQAVEMSLLHFLFYVKSNEYLENMAALGGGNQDARIVGGSHLISERIACGLGAETVQLNARVRLIDQRESLIRVETDAGDFRAERVIVALPPALAGRLDYRPALPPLRDALTQQMPMGRVIKVQIAWETPFWRASGLSGFSDNDDGPLHFTVDSSPPDGSCGVIAGFFTADHARVASQLTKSERRDLTIDHMVNCFGPEARNPVEYVEMDWTAEEFTRGCFGGRLGAGAWTRYGPALTEPVGRIFWAGSETATVSNGYMDGAVRSGKRAAQEVAGSIRQTSLVT